MIQFQRIMRKHKPGSTLHGGCHVLKSIQPSYVEPMFLVDSSFIFSLSMSEGFKQGSADVLCVDTVAGHLWEESMKDPQPNEYIVIG